MLTSLPILMLSTTRLEAKFVVLLAVEFPKESSVAEFLRYSKAMGARTATALRIIRMAGSIIGGLSTYSALTPTNSRGTPSCVNRNSEDRGDMTSEGVVMSDGTEDNADNNESVGDDGRASFRLIAAVPVTQQG